MSLKPVKRPFGQRQVLICTNVRDPLLNRASCGANGGVELRERLKAEIKRRGLKGEVMVNGASCLGFCPDQGCAVAVYPDNAWLLMDCSPEDEQALLARVLPG